MRWAPGRDGFAGPRPERSPAEQSPEQRNNQKVKNGCQDRASAKIRSAGNQDFTGALAAARMEDKGAEGNHTREAEPLLEARKR